MDISDLNPADVLAALYNRASPLGLGFLHYEAKPMTAGDAQVMLDSGQTYFDYVNGRVMKVRIDGSGELRTDLFNRDNGLDAAENIIGALRERLPEHSTPEWPLRGGFPEIVNQSLRHPAGSVGTGPPGIEDRNMSKHTPWTYQPNLLTPRFWSIMDATGSVVVAEVEGTEDLVSSIVRAVNCHEDLLEALKALTARCRQSNLHLGGDFPIAEADAALAKAAS